MAPAGFLSRHAPACVGHGTCVGSDHAIAEGDVTVLQRERPIARLGRADGLGEIALMRSVPRGPADRDAAREQPPAGDL